MLVFSLLVDRIAVGYVGVLPGHPFNASELATLVALRESAALLMIWFVARRYLGAGFADLGLTKPTLRDILLGVVGAAVFFLFVGPEVVRIFPPTQVNQIREAFESGDFEDRIWLLFVSGIYSPLAQEIEFRGLLLGGMLERTGAPIALGVSILVFTLAHWVGGASSMATAATLGVVQGLLFIWRRSLTASITLHIVYNTLIGIVTMSALHAWHF
ncbi:MAG TPA: type II CAAX endopeptidase family protein [Candidatus Eremiobacteraceae bacterium]|nr:type II CAAX endopeptidase family protein [Candidatus Eremiobacteraceae bacterium]